MTCSEPLCGDEATVPPILNSCVTVPLLSTFTCAVFVPNFSCQASTVYVPGGTFLISKLPSSLVTAKKGCLTTPIQAFIQGCWLHLTGISISARLKTEVMGAAFWPCACLNGSLFLGCTLTLCVVGSLFVTF